MMRSLLCPRLGPLLVRLLDPEALSALIQGSRAHALIYGAAWVDLGRDPEYSAGVVTARLLRPLDFSRLESGVKARLVRKGMMLECLVRISCEIAHAFVAGSYSLYEQICSEDKPHVRPSWSPGDVDAWMGCDPSRHAEMAVAFRREALKRGIWLVDLTTSNVSGNVASESVGFASLCDENGVLGLGKSFDLCKQYFAATASLKAGVLVTHCLDLRFSVDDPMLRSSLSRLSVALGEQWSNHLFSYYNFRDHFDHLGSPPSTAMARIWGDVGSLIFSDSFVPQTLLEGLPEVSDANLDFLEKFSLIGTADYFESPEPRLEPIQSALSVLERFDIDVCKVAMTVDALGKRHFVYGDETIRGKIRARSAICILNRPDREATIERKHKYEARGFSVVIVEPEP